MLMTATTWAITGPQFLWAYGVLCAIAAGAILLQWRRILGPREPAEDGLADLGLYELAALGGGPDLAIKSAASQLHRDGLIKAGSNDGLEPIGELGELGEDADPVERAVLETVRDAPGISGDEMRAQVSESAAVQSMTAELTRDGLLIGHDLTTTLARRILLLGGLLASLGIARIVAGLIGGQPVLVLVLMVVVVAVGTVGFAGRAPIATNRGKARLERWRDAHDDLRRNPIGGECALAAALFGASVLWLASPDIASALGVEREGTSNSGGSGGGCGSGCGGCGGCGG